MLSESSCEKQQCTEGPLTGIRILDMTRILAGPFCTMILGDLGAEIIKIESPDGGDESRNWGPPFINGESAYFLSVNRNKKSIAIDIKAAQGRDLIKKIAINSDVFYCSAFNILFHNRVGFGSTGPYSTRPGFDVIAASIGGLLNITGPENGEPCKIGVAMTDLSTGLYAHGAIMAALLQRIKTGKGQKIDCNLLSTQVSLLQVTGNLKILCEILNIHHYSTDPRFLTNKDRVQKSENSDF
ncbi:succinate--hydroxymethylglutarate CoA-transferase [Caerostris extrusa]|uniref:Succinate--hydroxymethylglutarate CoA-transferase n=1 Tax=Caerostris extrusa TaxID=172846 RepID=A0AAV4V877_CAEEX|nr:succinate--hydroxymethylglutarate CoA-transferase [Caerostris extrusa]